MNLVRNSDRWHGSETATGQDRATFFALTTFFDKNLFQKDFPANVCQRRTGQSEKSCPVMVSGTDSEERYGILYMSAIVVDNTR